MPDQVIEFFGLPGAGKTTLAHELAKELGASSSRVTLLSELVADGRPFAFRLARRLGLIAAETLRNPKLLRALDLVRNLEGSPKSKAKAAYNTLSTAAAYARASRRKGIVIADQGWLQAIWSIQVFSGNAPGDLQALVDKIANLPGPDRFVIIETSAEVAKERLHARESKHSRLQQGGAETDSALWTRAKQVAAALPDALPGDRIVSKIDGTRSPAETLAALKAALLEIET